MNKNIIFILVIFFFIKGNLIAVENKILLKIDNEIITTIDVSNQINYLIAFNPKIKELQDQRIFEIAKQTIIKEKIKKLEILKKIEKINIEDKYLDEYLKSKYFSLGFDDKNQFDEYLKINNLNIDKIREKISIELVWNQLIYEKFIKNVKLDEEEIKNKILDQKNRKTKEYLLSELVFQISDETNVNKKYEEIRNEIEQNGFENAAIIYSISDTSTSGGKIGWIKENSLNDKIKKVVMETKIGSYTKPMRIPSGFLILFVKNIKEINENLEINIENEIAQNIEIATEQQLNDFSNIYYNKIKKEFSISEI